MDNQPLSENLIIADAHVHLYPNFSPEELLEAALHNFKKIARRDFPNVPWVAFLFLGESKEENGFSFLNRLAGDHKHVSPERTGKWSFHQTREDCSLYGRFNEEGGFYIIAGRQIKTAENMEILALGTNHHFEEERPIKELIEMIGKCGAIPVIPWGVGKWLGPRGRMIKTLLQSQVAPWFFLGDSRKRPVLWPKSALFKQGALIGVKNLPGSDPLPLSGQDKEPGGYGFQVMGPIDADYPFKSIKKLLLTPEILPVPYGRGENLFRFGWNQLRLRIKAGK
jgi:hypothetical protein